MIQSLKGTYTYRNYSAKYRYFKPCFHAVVIWDDMCSVISGNSFRSDVGYLAKSEQFWASANGLLHDEIADDRSIAIYIYDVFQVRSS